MLNKISNLGITLNKKEQKSINGGNRWSQCGPSTCCLTFPNGHVLREPCKCYNWNSNCILL